MRPPNGAKVAPVSRDRVLSFVDRRAPLLALLLILVGSLRIISTYNVFNHTADEPATVACGMELLDKGVYRWEPQHPPLARVLSAVGPYLTGIRSQNTPKIEPSISMLQEGVRILYSGGHYQRTLALARLGILPFFWIGCLTVYLWGARYFSRPSGLAALLAFSFLPPVLAHSGLATLDMAQTALLSAAFLAGMVWLETPSAQRALLFGAATGLMVISRLSTLAFFPVAVLLALIVWLLYLRPAFADLVRLARQRIPTLAIAILTGFLIIWAGYLFSFGKVPSLGFSLPFPELFAGIQQVREHAAGGASGYLLGEYSDHGFWNFYLVGLGVKSPIGFLLLTAIGIGLTLGKGEWNRRLRIPLAFSIAVLLIGMLNTINIGLRHVLPVYTGLSLLAGVAIIRLWQAAAPTRKWTLPVMLVLTLWMVISSAASHPDYLPYFNELAGSEPENILVDSDLDWGQDMNRLGARLRELHAPSVAFLSFVMADLEKEHGFPPIHGSNPVQPSEGWNAVSITVWKGIRRVRWPDAVKPTERVGKGILLFYFPPAHSSTALSPHTE